MLLLLAAREHNISVQEAMRTIISDYGMPDLAKLGFILNNYVNDLTFFRLNYDAFVKSPKTVIPDLISLPRT